MLLIQLKIINYYNKTKIHYRKPLGIQQRTVWISVYLIYYEANQFILIYVFLNLKKNQANDFIMTIIIPYYYYSFFFTRRVGLAHVFCL